jgi:hypothetical protein
MDKNWTAALDAARKAVTIAPDLPEVRMALVSVNIDAKEVGPDARDAAKEIQTEMAEAPRWVCGRGTSVHAREELRRSRAGASFRDRSHR